ncbi:hypothetical protein FLL45_11220 [Aliikangiella marina]|uniref:Sugar transporter n=1 Tax=Aliikangiella marina TaxID=1712262 RepID=A0A545TE67_9GAMM|nr:hypothetical protein [Aliikangiella marina]TQV75481.1 hypothetical protein FLL45_11220 [Aliikangiella marina]
MSDESNKNTPYESPNADVQMSNKKVPVWFWVVSIIALIWNLLGLMAFVMQLLMTPEMIAAMPQAERSLYENFPGWVYIPFGAAVIGGTLGCVFLLMKKGFAFELFIISLVGVIVQNGYSLLMTNAAEILGVQAIIMPLVVIAIGVGLIIFSAKTKKLGYLS